MCSIPVLFSRIKRCPIAAGKLVSKSVFFQFSKNQNDDQKKLRRKSRREKNRKVLGEKGERTEERHTEKGRELPPRFQVVGMPDISIVSSQAVLSTGTAPPV